MGLDAKKSEVHGMSQRGGIVTSHVRFGKKVFSPLIPHRESDVILAFELAEGLRWVGELRPGGKIVNTQKIVPTITTTGKFFYPEKAEEKIRGYSPGATLLDAYEIALEELGNPRMVNTILLSGSFRNRSISKRTSGSK